ncbi:hypothetical protein DFH06DRAFT_558797 [Mycena polygramma]|nr:hypothetical protein DFH06DRAFT_558797 [Mycena polygramma]
MALLTLQAPDIRERLRHNILPSDMERSALMVSLAAGRQRMAEIQANQPTPDPFDLEEITLRQYISELSSLLAPIRRLTHGVLGHIFADPDLCQRITIGRTARPVAGCDPYALTSVSHYWMCVAFQTPELWSNFYITACGGSRALRELRMCLQRSGALALSIYLDLPLLEARGDTVDILEELMLNAERWGRLEMPLKGIAMLAPVHGRVHRLQEVSFHRSHSLAALRGSLDVFEVAPQLRIARFEGLRHIGDLPTLPFRQIEKVTFANSESIISCDALSKLPNVVELDIARSQLGFSLHCYSSLIWH